MEAKYTKLMLIEEAAQAGVQKLEFKIKGFCHVCKTDPSPQNRKLSNQSILCTIVSQHTTIVQT